MPVGSNALLVPESQKSEGTDPIRPMVVALSLPVIRSIHMLCLGQLVEWMDLLSSSTTTFNWLHALMTP